MSTILLFYSIAPIQKLSESKHPKSLKNQLKIISVILALVSIAGLYMTAQRNTNTSFINTVSGGDSTAKLYYGIGPAYF